MSGRSLRCFGHGGKSPASLFAELTPVIYPMTFGTVENWAAKNPVLTRDLGALPNKWDASYLRAGTSMSIFKRWFIATFRPDERATTCLKTLQIAMGVGLAQITRLISELHGDAYNVFVKHCGESAGTTSGESSNELAFSAKANAFNKALFEEIRAAKFIAVSMLLARYDAPPAEGHTDQQSVFGDTQWPFPVPNRDEKTREVRICLAVLSMCFEHATALIDHVAEHYNCSDADIKKCANLVAHVINEHFYNLSCVWLQTPRFKAGKSKELVLRNGE